MGSFSDSFDSCNKAPFPANLGWAIGGAVALPAVVLASWINTTSPELEWEQIVILTVVGTFGAAMGAGFSARWQRKVAVSPTKYALTWMGAFLVAWTVFLIWPYVSGDRHYSSFFGRVLTDRSIGLFVLFLALFGMLGGTGTALWSRPQRPQVLSVLVMGFVGIMSVGIASAVSAVGLYLAVGVLSTVLQQFGELFVSLSLAPALVCATVAGAVGGAIGGTFGEGVASVVLDGKHDLLAS